MVAAPARSFLNTTFTETPGSRKREQRPGALIGAEPGQPNGGAVFHDTAVWIRKADAPRPPPPIPR